MDLNQTIIAIHEVAQATHISEIAISFLIGLIALPVILQIKIKETR